MMKRTARMIDVPKLRRNLKGRGRVAETVCCGHFGGFAYVKFVLLWLSCIALDLFIGFRFELLYPVWLLMRSCYDSFRFQGLVSSLQYSNSVIIVAERGIGSAHLLLWIAIISFEYNWRYRGDSPLHLLKDSILGSTFNFFTGGIFANWLELHDLSTSSEMVTTDFSKECYPSPRFVNPTGNSLGDFDVALTAAFAQSSSLTLDLSRPFAAHCIGYPVVMLGFGLKTYFRLWRVKRRQREVSLANEIYCKILTEALPSLYEGPKIYSRCNGTILQEQEQIEFESEICSGSLQNLSICASSSSTAVVQRKNLRAGASWKQNGWKHIGINSKKVSVPLNGTSSTRKERAIRENNDDDDTASSVSLSVASKIYLWRVIWDLVWSIILYILGGVVELPSSSLDDRISLSSNEVESEDEMEQEETSSQPDDASPRSYSRTKGGRSRGHHLQNHTEYILSPLTSVNNTLSSSLGANCALSTNLLNLAADSIQQDKQLYSSASNADYQNMSITNINVVENGGLSTGSAASLNGKTRKYDAEELLETLRSDLRAAQSQETELRYMLQQYMNGEKQLKEELQQLKLKQEQSDNKLANIMKVHEQDKSTMQLLEKKLIDTQAKKNELEKELTAEKRNKIKEEHAAARALAAAQSNKSVECTEACKTKKADLEKELRIIRRELKVKEELTIEYEEELRQLRQYKESNDLQVCIILVSCSKYVLEEEHSSGEITVSRKSAKAKLFYALNEARGQMADFQQQLFAKEADLRLKDVELMNLRGRFGSSTSTSDPTKLTLAADNRGPLSIKTARLGPAGNAILSPTVSDLSSISKSHVIAEQDIFNSASSAYMPYTFTTHSSQDEHSMFDSSSTIPPNSVSPSPASRLPSVNSDAFRFTNSKFSPTSTNTNSSRNS
ncbi:Macoilin-2 [Dirofilaria immitis]|nr:Macoilin-2 [Dirofilaria immitis]